jgi:hypothetical protein
LNKYKNTRKNIIDKNTRKNIVDKNKMYMNIIYLRAL